MTRHDRSRPSRAIAILVAGLLAVPGLTAGRAAAAEPTVIRYLQTRGSVEPFEFADALGWLKGKNIRIEAEGYAQGGPEGLVALASGAVDIGSAATSAIINAIAGGAKIVAVAPDGGVSATVNSKFFVLAGSPIRTAQDLKGKSIVVNTLGAHLDYTIREYLRRNGLDQHDVTLITAPGPQLDLILRHRQADVVAVGAWQGVFAGKIAAEGGARVLFTDYDVLGDIVLGSIAMKTAFVAAHPQAVRDLVTANARAVDWVREHPQQARTLFASILKARGDNPQLAQWWPGFGLRAHALYTGHDAQFWIDALVRAGRLKPGQFTAGDIESNRFNAFAKEGSAEAEPVRQAAQGAKP